MGSLVGQDSTINQVKILDPLVIRWSGDNLWFVEREIRYCPDQGSQITVPAGATTDLASIPRILHPILSPAGTWARASVLHDYLYSQRMFRREKCDDLFLEAMVADRVRERAVIYKAVRLFGGRAYLT